MRRITWNAAPFTKAAKWRRLSRGWEAPQVLLKGILQVLGSIEIAGSDGVRWLQDVTIDLNPLMGGFNMFQP